VDYLIHAPAYKRTSGGVRALHKLCHCLNQAGQVAYVSTSATNPSWDTPHPEQGVVNNIAVNGIVVYPEVVRGNPWNAKRVVRYILNRPGLLGGDKEYDSAETLFSYSVLWQRFVPSGTRMLIVPVIETNIFNCTGDEGRSGGAFWVGAKGRSLPRISETEGLVEITSSWPDSWEAMADLFRSVEVFYSYTNYTGLLTEARLCGCPAVVVAVEDYVREDYCKGIGDTAGLAFWNKDPGILAANLRKAKETVNDFQELFREGMSKFDTQLEKFIEITQEL